MGYAARLRQITTRRGNLCVGIDPMPSVLSAWGLDATVEALERCARGIVAELAESVAVFKPQSAFFEAFGSAGVAVLERVLEDIRQAGALSILDVKRGDIGSSMAGYATAYLGDDSPLRADAITLSPYLGVGSLSPAIEQAVLTGRGIYVLARTSNPDGAAIQCARTDHASVAQHVVDAITEGNPRWDHAVGVVVGGTHADLGCDVSTFNGSILVPGIGAQGGTMEGIRDVFGDASSMVLPTVSRDVIGGGRDDLGRRAELFLANAQVAGL
ncbi:orotidine-5'-phosphate decarboxylase [Tessaracoccus antarcticus]|uniref:Orotidine-5'-phosphate decarboxylase n=2 Tax=Tessaracoccus antarcticus TaxID=2479848 RepID=A0A3M0GD12_9ACTN|nr:orotidine-5'-phosphate decarboxylase [Tessaracoccus antarcticus]